MPGRGLCLQSLCAAVWLAGVLAFAQAPQDDARTGARRYMEYCAGCHGADGHGGAKGPSLAGDHTANLSDDNLNLTLLHGTRGGMPPFAQIGNENIHALIQFLRLLENGSSSGAPQILQMPPGDARAGQTLYFGRAQCSSCHMVGGQGGFMARSLTHYARNRTADAIRTAIVNPDHPLIPSTRVVAVTTRNGQALTGVLRNEDEFSLELQTADGRYHLLNRNNVARVDYSDHSLMPRDYGTRLSPAELNDIVSFLMSAGEVQQASEGSDR